MKHINAEELLIEMARRDATNETPIFWNEREVKKVINSMASVDLVFCQYCKWLRIDDEGKYRCNHLSNDFDAGYNAYCSLGEPNE